MSDTPDFIAEVDEDEREFLSAFLSTTQEEDDATRNDTRLDWLLEKLAKRREQKARNNAIADARKLMVEDWRQGENAKIERAVSWLEFQIRELVPADSDAFSKTYGAKSRALPFGTIGYRKSPPTIEVFDEPKALEWAKLHKLEIKVKESVSKTELKKAIEYTQDPPDGFGLIPGGETFFVKTDDLVTPRGH